jgi:hypothetical protein
MFMDVDIARREWAARLTEQARQLRVVAAVAETGTMREELADYANRIDRQLRELEARPIASRDPRAIFNQTDPFDDAEILENGKLERPLRSSRNRRSRESPVDLRRASARC